MVQNSLIMHWSSSGQRSFGRLNLKAFRTSHRLPVHRSFHYSRVRYDYSNTIANLKIGKDTRVIFQGFTGRQATQNAQQSIEYGTKIVGGVRPGKDGEHLGLPVLPSVRAAKEQLRPDATAVYVAAQQAAGAIEEAIEAEIPLIVAVAEHIPLHDMLRVQSILRSQSKSRLVGANSPGMISATGKCRLGFHPLPCFKPGCIGIVAKSGTLSYETVAATTRAGLGQSLVIGMGGDPLPGTDFVDALKVFETDEETKGIILVGEIGGKAEDEAAAWIQDYRKRVEDPKSIMALIAGVQAPSGRTMGHAGAYISPGEKKARAKIKALQNAGVVMTNHPSKFGDVMNSLLGNSSAQVRSVKQTKAAFEHQKRHHHHHSSRPLSSRVCSPHSSVHYQRRFIHITEKGSLQLLRDRKVPISSAEDPDAKDHFVTITFDRSLYRPCFVSSYSIGGESAHNHARSYPLTLNASGEHETAIFDDIAAEVLSEFQSKTANLGPRQAALDSMRLILESLSQIFFDLEGSALTVRVSQNMDGKFEVARTHFEFDDAAQKSKRQPMIEEMKDSSEEDPWQAEAAKDGIVYIRLPGEGQIGTVVNGAGLAMNTVDAITDLGGKCANFLDTGGKATKETVKSSFSLVLHDERVKVVFVNIFGGLTLCDMIAEGIMLAYQDLGIKVPVVVRLRGTNEEAGQKMITDSGLKLHAFDDFDEAANKAIELSRNDA